MGWSKDAPWMGRGHLERAKADLDGYESRPTRAEIDPVTEEEAEMARRSLAAQACPLHYPDPDWACPACGERS